MRNFPLLQGLVTEVRITQYTVQTNEFECFWLLTIHSLVIFFNFFWTDWMIGSGWSLLFVYYRDTMKWYLRIMLFCPMDTRLQQSNEVTWHFQESESEDSWNHRMSHLEGTMHIIYSNRHILIMGRQKRFHGSDCDISKTLNHLQGRRVIVHSISLYWASPVSQLQCYIQY